MSRLNHLQKLFIVESLARYCTLSEVRDQLKEEFGITAETGQLSRYKPGTNAGSTLSKPLRDAFDNARSVYLSECSETPLVHQSFRFAELYSLYRQIKHKEPMNAARLLQQAAKESGGIFVRPRDFEPEAPNDLIKEETEREIEMVYGPEPDQRE